ncbi:unnamed protein product [Clonostachys byssicola]|uniref:Uncharacterized protein n=1 Tax=Clonostachys byssicola TaxID=160290 RepID=A0A9N9YC48_9HYPO|nr:unnamed protein product [Clonostachys byssicola]
MAELPSPKLEGGPSPPAPPAVLTPVETAPSAPLAVTPTPTTANISSPKAPSDTVTSSPKPMAPKVNGIDEPATTEEVPIREPVREPEPEKVEVPVIEDEEGEDRASKQVNGTKNGIDDVDGESELSEPDSNVHSPPGVHDLADEIVVSNRPDEDQPFSPNHAHSEEEDETMVDAQEEHISPYPKRKRTTTVNGAGEKISDSFDSTLEEKAVETITNGKPKPSRAPAGGVKGIILGHWRDSEVPEDVRKHAVIGFIDIRDRLRTRIQPVNLIGEVMTVDYPLPPGPGGSWVTFDRIFFLPHLIGLDQSQIKEYVRVRSEMNEETDEERIAAEKAVAKDVARRIRPNSSDHPTPQLQIAYGSNLPDHMAALARPDAKRRKTSSGFAPIHPAPSPALDSPRGGPSPAYQRPTLDTLPGTRPTRILLGYWSKSDEKDPKDRHAVYGILGHNDMFRVKLVRETRDGRYVDGNFPTAPGALWIAYEEVEMEPHLKSLARAEIKEYCRVRQYQIDQGETSDEKEANQVKAAAEAQARIGGNPTTIKHTAPSSVTNTSDNIDEPDSPTQRGLGGQKTRTSRRTEAKALAQAQAQAEQDKIDRDESRVNGRSRPSMGDEGLNGRVNNIRSERAVALAQREIARAEAAQGRADLHASHRERAAAVAAEEATAVAAAAVATPGATTPNGTSRFAASDDMQRLNQVWARQESLRVRAASEDAKVYDGRKYERKSTGPFTGKLVAQGTLINIDGEDYVEYRVLTRPSFF